MCAPARKLAREEVSRQGAETGLGLSLPAGFMVGRGEFFSFRVSIKQRRSLPHLLLGVPPSTASREHRDGYCTARGGGEWACGGCGTRAHICP